MSEGSRTVEDVRNLLHSWRGLDAQRMVDFYNRWAETYDQDMSVLSWRSPQMVVDFLCDNFCGSREEARVLDVACGSGLVAKMMFEQGFRHFVGVDGSEVMLQKAAESGLYQDLRLALLGTEPLPAQIGAFDVVVIIGALREGHVPPCVFRELCAAAKPGGYICLSRSDSKSQYGKKYDESVMKELQWMETEKLWTPVDVRDMNQYMIDFHNQQDQQQDQFLTGTMNLYRKPLS
ncbi:methyltransferase-like protein 27 [Centropristis striata]|uniref:methyltransferase-like protein 27 n=1 Tax=Centropristis striata TaxID=184440 RepID=UPI0027E213D2|nr:methyltransferase-like protein 27 [Centropristis striata]